MSKYFQQLSPDQRAAQAIQAITHGPCLATSQPVAYRPVQTYNAHRLSPPRHDRLPAKPAATSLPKQPEYWSAQKVSGSLYLPPLSPQLLCETPGGPPPNSNFTYWNPKLQMWEGCRSAVERQIAHGHLNPPEDLALELAYTNNHARSTKQLGDEGYVVGWNGNRLVSLLAYALDCGLTVPGCRLCTLGGRSFIWMGRAWMPTRMASNRFKGWRRMRFQFCSGRWNSGRQ